MKAHILIVDDIAINIQLVATILSSYDYELSFAVSGRDALAQIAETPFDLILLDLMMPGMDGMEVARILKSNDLTRHIPIIFLTARNDESSLVQAFEVGVADFLSKPVQHSELIARVRTHLALKFAQDELRQRNRELASHIEMKNRLLSIASHDLKSPLMSVHGFASLLQRSKALQSDGDAQEMLSFISRAAHRMQGLISELLDTAALEMGRIELEVQDCNVLNLLEETVDHNRALARAKSQRIFFEYDLIGEYDFEDEIPGDARRLRQVFDNLLNNAIKYSPPGSELKVYLQLEADCLKVRFYDRGPGFRAEDLPKMFGFFQRLSAQPTGHESSTGIGLALVKQIVDMHNGKIELEENSPQGSVFLLQLPRQHSAAPLVSDALQRS